MGCNRETILDELNDLENSLDFSISPVLEDYLLRIAKTGDTMFPWIKLKPLVKKKLEIVLDDFHSTYPTDLPLLPNVEAFKFDILKTNILEALNSFYSAPFTIQRICELLTMPRKNYKRIDKFMRGLEKNVLVVSTVEPKSRFNNEVNNNGSPPSATMMNGVIAPASSESTDKGFTPPPNMLPSVKLTNCASQFDGFGILSGSPSVIMNDIPSILHREKKEEPETAKEPNSNSSCINTTSVSAGSSDISFRKSCTSTKSKIINPHTSTRSENSSPDNSLGLNSMTNSSLESFSIFSTSSMGLSVSPSEKSTSLDPGKTLSSSSRDSKLDLSSFQSKCDTHLVESNIDIAHNVVITPTRVIFPEKRRCTPESPCNATLPDNGDFFPDLCCQPILEDPDSPGYIDHSSDNFDETSESKSSEAFSGDKVSDKSEEEKASTATKERTEICCAEKSDSKILDKDEHCNQTNQDIDSIVHKLDDETDSENNEISEPGAKSPAENTEVSRDSEEDIGSVTKEEKMDIELPSDKEKHFIEDFNSANGDSTLPDEETEEMEED